MKKCKNCGKELAGNAMTCPDCGGDQRTIFGRHKILTVISVIVVLWIITVAGSLASFSILAGVSVSQPKTDETVVIDTQEAGLNNIESEREEVAVCEYTVGSLLDARDDNERYQYDY